MRCYWSTWEAVIAIVQGIITPSKTQTVSHGNKQQKTLEPTNEQSALKNYRFASLYSLLYLSLLIHSCFSWLLSSRRCFTIVSGTTTWHATACLRGTTGKSPISCRHVGWSIRFRKLRFQVRCRCQPFANSHLTIGTKKWWRRSLSVSYYDDVVQSGRIPCRRKFRKEFVITAIAAEFYQVCKQIIRTCVRRGYCKIKKAHA